MTPAEWKEVENELRVPWGVVRLRVDGYDLQLVIRSTKPLRYVIFPYVNGWHRGEWLSRNAAGEWHDEARRFLPLRRLSIYNRAELKKLKLRKSGFEKLSKEYIETRDYCWKSFASLKRHLIANNKVIEYVGCGYETG